MVNKTKCLGIIGGLGPETGCRFCLNLNNKFRDLNNAQPNIILHNLPISFEAENNIINGRTGKEHLRLLKESVKMFNLLDVDSIVIPCNTVHKFIPELRKTSKNPIISIIEEVSKECKNKNFRKIGLLASETTIKSKLHSKLLNKEGIEIIIPEKSEQKNVNKIIIKIIHNKSDEKDRNVLLRIIKNLENKGTEAVILGCTDLPLLISKASIPVIDSCSLLEDTAVKILSNGKKNEYTSKTYI